MAESQVWIPVNASMRGFVSTVAKEAAKAAGAGGKNLEQGFRESGERSGQAVADGLAAQANKVDAASRALATARNAEVQASSDAAVAEEKLNQLRVAGNYTMGDLAKAETALEVAKQKAADAAARVSARESDLNTVREGGEATSRQLVRAEDQLAAARVKHIDATGKARAAEAVLEDAEQDAAMALERLEESTAALTTIREKYGAESKEAAAAEKELARAQKDSDKAALDVVKAQGQVKKAAADLANAQDDVRSKTMLLGGVQRDLADSVQRAGQEVGEAGDKVRGFGKDMDAAEGSAHGFVSGIADVAKNAAVAAAGVAGIGAAAAVGLDASGAISEMNLQLGLTGESAAALGQEVGDVLGSGLASNADEAAGAVGALSSQFRYLGSEGEQSAAQLSDNFLAFTKTFGVEMSEATQLAGSLITNGLAPDVETASDLMMAAFQRVPAAMRDELPEVMNEYGTFFSSLGFSGQEAFGLLVNSAELGKIGLDKVGDALKEFGIRATDLGDTGAVEALDALGLAGEDIQNRLLAGGETAKGAFDQVVDSLLGVKDPAEQAQLAVSLFGTPIEDLDKAKIPGFLKGLSDSGDAMAGFEGASQAAADTIANSLGGRMDKLKGTVTALASDGFMLLWDVTENKIVPAFQNFGDWVQRNEAWLGPLVAAVGAAAGVWGLWTGAILLWQNAVKVATAVQAAFNGVVALNPIMRAVMAVAALAAGVTYFFTQTETGRVMWQQFTDALSAGWDWVVGKFTAGWTWIRDAVFVPMAAFTAGTLLPAFQSVWAGIQVGWDAFTGALSWAYNAIILPVFNGLVTAGKFMFAVIATAVLTPMLIAWNLLSSGIQWGWETVIRPAWDLMVAAANWMWVGVLQPVFGWIQTGWQL
ncbi:phage tail tape measure protein, partial [Corynebacterium lipophiloflavum]